MVMRQYLLDERHWLAASKEGSPTERDPFSNCSTQPVGEGGAVKGGGRREEAEDDSKHSHSNRNNGAMPLQVSISIWSGDKTEYI